MNTHDIELPPLPEPNYKPGAYGMSFDAWGQNKMIEYARTAIKPYIKRIVELEASLIAYASSEPVAFLYEIASTLMSDGTYSNWSPRLSFSMPNAPDGSIRNLRCLYAAPQPAEPVKVDAEASVPSDDALVDALINLEYDNYEQSFSGYKNRQADIALIRAALARYGNIQQEK